MNVFRGRGSALLAVVLAAGAAATVSCSDDDGPGSGASGNGSSVGDAECRLADDSHVVRNELVAGSVPSNRDRLIRFVQFTDEHVMDDDGTAVVGGSPLDPTIPTFESAQRYQDEYTDEVLEAMVRTANACHDDDPYELLIATGDNTDLGTVAELRRFIDNLDGDFDRIGSFEKRCRAGLAGTPEAVLDQLCTRLTGRGIADTQSQDPQISNPLYQFAPTRTLLQLVDTLAAVTTGRRADGSANPAGSTAIRSPGLPESLRCRAGDSGCENGKLDVPYYVAFGNHDGYLRGTIVQEPGVAVVTEAVGRRFLVEQHDFIDELFETSASPGPVGHGFDHVDAARWNDSDGRNDGYYAFDAGNGRFRMIVLNTIVDGLTGAIGIPPLQLRNPFALDDGTIDSEQFAWIQGELAQARSRGQLVLAFSHHPDLTFAEYGKLAPFVPIQVTAAELDAEFARWPNFVAWVAGHTHRNRIRAFVVDGSGRGTNGRVTTPVACVEPGACRGFWQIETASLIDDPQEARELEIYDHGDGTGSIRATLLEHDFERSKVLAREDDRCQFFLADPAGLERLTSEADLSAICGTGQARGGTPVDRNVELLFRLP